MKKNKDPKPNKEEIRMIRKAKAQSRRAKKLMIQRGLIRGRRGR